MDFGPSYQPTFQLRLPAGTEEVTVIVRDRTETDIWECDVDLTGNVFILLQHLT